MIYPQLSEYLESIKDSENYFKHLDYLRPVLDAKGEPVMTSGNFAVVFKMRDSRDGSLHALKCFTRDVKGRAEAYEAIARELRYVQSPFLTRFTYWSEEVFVDSKQATEQMFPVLLMDWVEGMDLGKYVRSHCTDRQAMHLLAYRFSQLSAWLMAQSFAHGDIKPDNVIVRPDGTPVLVDYDGMYVPSMKGKKARELGSPDFRHPSRTQSDFDERIDDFSLASVLLSLRAIAEKPQLLSAYGAADRFLFSAADYRDISQSKALREIYPSQTDEVNRLTALFTLSLSQGNLKGVMPSLLLLSPPEEEDTTYEVFTVKGVTFKMVRVEGGSFTMGATPEQGNDAYDNESPAHSVTLSSYSIGETQVTQQLWEAVMGRNLSRFKGNIRPVERVSWDDCQTFIKKLNAMTGRSFRLPTEAEWEFAARGGNKSKGYKFAGSDNLDTVAWYCDNSGGQTHDVATKQPNELGIYDMSGNVWEWCQDWFAQYPSSPQTNPTGPATGSYRVSRGGRWGSGAGAAACRTASTTRPSSAAASSACASSFSSSSKQSNRSKADDRALGR